ncbi:4547_t:CDS:2 [Ambispora leptoticha]|uniref:4547_t:CDS:1 n=1 Tax=Ambispora leptoticha TaxID=144679 RepID=A0A9N9C4A9_9GLOM|nr:4547_t:CDS:2 [Ambispora leptoticha]
MYTRTLLSLKNLTSFRSGLLNNTNPLPPSIITHSHFNKAQRCLFFTIPKLNDLLSSQKQYTGEKIIGYSQSQLYEVVANINDYHLFVPFCTNSTVLSHEQLDSANDFMTAELGVGFQGFEETYISEVTCHRPKFVKAQASSDKLFRHLLEFEFASPLHAQVSNMFFDQVSTLMVKAFENRCGQIYGPPSAELPAEY